jgi:Flp pilus assembly protein TadD
MVWGMTIDEVRALIAAGRLDEAESACQRLLGHEPDHADALLTLGALRLQGGRPADAVTPLRRAAALAPAAAVVHSALGNALKALGRFDEALAAHGEALRLQPGFAEGWSNLGATWLARGDPERAVEAMARAAALKPDHAELQFNLGRTRLAVDDLAGAETSLRRVLELSPGHVHARVALGTTLKGLGRLDEAIQALRLVTAVAPDHADGHWNLALALLMRGDWTEGWAEYEWRRRIPTFAIERFDQPDWDGTPLRGRTLLVHAEQALGDAIQFARFAEVATRRGGPVVLRCPGKLVSLLGGLRGDVRVVPGDAPPPPFDVQAPLMSLPHLLAVTGSDLAAHDPYLAPNPDLASRWSARIGTGGGLRIGIGWQGSPSYLADHQRSMPLHHLLPLARLPGVRLFSLQKGHGSDQLEEMPACVEIDDLGAELDTGPEAFVDTAAAVTALDLLVCTDTALPHLAGALGVPVWLLLPHVPDWRWGLHGEACPWYPGMRLLRQATPGDWDGVVERAVADLTRLRS